MATLFVNKDIYCDIYLAFFFFTPLSYKIKSWDSIKKVKSEQLDKKCFNSSDRCKNRGKIMWWIHFFFFSTTSCLVYQHVCVWAAWSEPDVRDGGQWHHGASLASSRPFQTSQRTSRGQCPRGKWLRSLELEGGAVNLLHRDDIWSGWMSACRQENNPSPGVVSLWQSMATLAALWGKHLQSGNADAAQVWCLSSLPS